MRKLRSFAAVLAVVALVALLPATCPCAPRPVAHSTGHDCCAPPTGVRAADHGCCDTGPTLVAYAAPHTAAPAVCAPGVVAVLAPLPVEVAPALALAPRAAASPPPLVLRI